jgi:hypothetical protein
MSKFEIKEWIKRATEAEQEIENLKAKHEQDMIEFYKWLTGEDNKQEAKEGIKQFRDENTRF